MLKIKGNWETWKLGNVILDPGFRIRIQDHNSGFRLRVQDQDSGFKITIHDSGSGFRIRVPIASMGRFSVLFYGVLK